jgi:subtilisin family serine protease
MQHHDHLILIYFRQVVAGVDWVTQQRSNNGRKSVANMSLGGGSSIILDDAVNRAVEAGVHMIVAAGNEFQNACNRSPAGANGVTAVGATDDIDSMAYFSNYGECVEIFAPGVNVIAAYPTDSTATLSGTSMAAPHVAGVVADILSKCPDVSPPTMELFLKANANKDKVNGLPPGHTDHDDLVYKTCELGCPSE